MTGDKIFINLGGISHGTLTFSNASLSDCLRYAYDLTSDQQLVGPDWIKSKEFRYEIVAKIAPPLTRDQASKMLRLLLNERFKLESHWEPREMTYYELSVGKHSFWERRFNSYPAIAGRIVNLNGVAFTIVGVAAKEFSGTGVIPQIPDFWAPVSMQKQLAPGRDWLDGPGDFQFQILARLKPTTTRSRAEAETAVVIRQFANTHTETDRTTTVTLQRTALLGNTEDVRFQASAFAVMLLVGMVLLVGCVSIADMRLAQR